MISKPNLLLGSSNFLHYSGLSRIIGSRYGGNGTIFTLHSVVPDPSQFLFEFDRVSTEFLDSFLLWLRRKDIDIVSLDEALQRLWNDDPRRFVVITCDDGYADNFEHMLPVMEKYGAPYTVFVTTHWITREFSYWSGALQRMFSALDEVEIEPMGQRFTCPTLREKTAGLHRVLDWCYNDCDDPGVSLRGVFRKYGISPEAVLDEDALSLAQLKALSHSSLVTIGAHTTTHPRLSSLSLADAVADIGDNRDFLQSIVQKPVEHLAYPFGSPRACGEREEEIAAEIGFKTASTTRKGNLFPRHLERPYALPRGTIRAGLESIGVMAVQMDGVPRFVNSCAGDPVVAM